MHFFRAGLRRLLSRLIISDHPASASSPPQHLRVVARQPRGNFTKHILALLPHGRKVRRTRIGDHAGGLAVRVPTYQGREFFEVLAAHGKTTRMVTYPGSPHFPNA